MTFFMSMIPHLVTKGKPLSYDIVHAHMAVPAGFAGVLVGKILGKPVLITSHGSDIHTYPNYRFLRTMVFYALNQAKKVVFVSNALRQTAQRKGILHRSTAVIHNGVDQSRFKPLDKAAQRKRLGLPLDRKIILFVGNLLPIKGLPLLLSAFAPLVRVRKDVELVIVGKGELRNELKRQAGILGIRRHIRLTGPVPHEEIPAWISACDVFCLPSREEGFPTVIPEVLSCGRPVVATRAGGIPEIITSDQQGILVHRHDCDELSRALSAALESYWDEKMIRESARHYTWERIATQYGHLYRELALAGRARMVSDKGKR
jgi:glycosyltransferase involved in cell wall biosynthesis